MKKKKILETKCFDLFLHILLKFERKSINFLGYKMMLCFLKHPL